MPAVLAAAPAAGFAEPVQDAQRTFAALMWALAEPALPRPLASALTPPAPLSPELAAVALTLLDYETPFLLDGPLAVAPVAAFLRFHTGAPQTLIAAEARFVLCADATALPDFALLAQGTAEYPDRSATVLAQVDRFTDGPLTFAGPGIPGTRRFGAEPLPADLAGRLAANAALFPLGIDLVLCAPGAVAGLPRTTRPVAPKS